MSAPDELVGGRRLADVPRTTVAAGAAGVARVVSRRLGRPAAWWGMLILIASEGMLFAALIATYYYLRFTNRAWPPDGLPRPALVVPLLLAALLALTSIPMHLGSRAAGLGRLQASRLLVAAALVVQAACLAYQLYDFHEDLQVFRVSHDAYSSIYYTLLAAEHAHVALGILFGVWLLAKLSGGLTTYRANAAMAIAWYWYFVSVATVAVTLTLVSARI